MPLIDIDYLSVVIYVIGSDVKWYIGGWLLLW